MLIAIGNSRMPSGEYFLMMSSLRHIPMGLSLIVVMVLNGGFILEYLHIQRTIQKSKSMSVT